MRLYVKASSSACTGQSQYTAVSNLYFRIPCLSSLSFAREWLPVAVLRKKAFNSPSTKICSALKFCSQRFDIPFISRLIISVILDPPDLCVAIAILTPLGGGSAALMSAMYYCPPRKGFVYPGLGFAAAVLISLVQHMGQFRDHTMPHVCHLLLCCLGPEFECVSIWASVILLEKPHCR